MKKDLYSHIKKLPYLDTSISFFSAHKQHVPTGWETYQSSHTAFEILLILDGAQESVINQKKYLLEQGDILLIAPGVLHTNRCFSDQGMSYFTAHFDIDDPALRYIMIKNGRLIYPVDSVENAMLRPILEEWIKLYDKTTPYTLSDRLFILEVLTRLMTTFVKISEEAAENQYDVQSLSLARTIAETIQHNFNAFFLNENRSKEQLLMKNIYQDANVSMSYGLEVFKKIYGISPKEYLDRLKLKEARRLLKNPDISVESISEQIGYANITHFSRQFKKWTGLSPRAYRKKTQEQD
ncbi:AraC family transcriptional regulator [Enterococcus sp. AZ109]|uniref:AraC family transcriptional regulator n=1 Tax=Enterococcus sp. AZ109 TaxID=2774634 RepID=UPI003F20B993